MFLQPNGAEKETLNVRSSHNTLEASLPCHQLQKRSASWKPWEANKMLSASGADG